VHLHFNAETGLYIFQQNDLSPNVYAVSKEKKLNRRYQCRRISIKVMQVKNPKLSERQYQIFDS
jgi:hypothetical protein